MKNELVKYLNNTILNQASKLRYEVRDLAPSTEQDLFNESGLKVWSGSSDNTIFQDASVNYAFRALHDKLHLETRFDFTPQAEMELGRIQASKYDGILADIIYCEVSRQAEYFLLNGIFVQDQVSFTKQFIKGL